MRNMMVIYGLIAVPFVASASPAEKIFTQKEYVQMWSPVAMEQMRTHKIPASITLAQGILESGNGNSELAQKANNHFGIKCHDWKGETIYMDDDKANECFRKYKTADESYKDHSVFLTGRSRYSKLFTYDINDYKSWAQGLKDAGYATNPKYPQQLIDLIERLELNRYDEQINPSDNKGSELLAREIDQENKEQSAETVIAIGYQTHKILEHRNKVNYIVARKGDTYYKISKEFGLGMWQLYRYNDFDEKKDLLEEGDIVYLQPKRRHAKEKDATYTAAKNMTWNEISQIHGIKVKCLLTMNGVASPNETVSKGQKVLLR